MLSRFLHCAAGNRANLGFVETGKCSDTLISSEEGHERRGNIPEFCSLIESMFDSTSDSSSFSSSLSLSQIIFARLTFLSMRMRAQTFTRFRPSLPDMHRPSLLFLRYRESGGISRRRKIQVAKMSFLARLPHIEGAEPRPNRQRNLCQKLTVPPCKQWGEHAKMIPSPRLADAEQFEF